ncbi:MarR family winged helix-turn-helix transcriptional regulator [Streptomyces sp. NPDC050560]|uniref:MarR family winged helix-turn-helix transcriptional regulator n=1 Tax=Streptomyces sp. NPDC050560 TaxID=3365630 RepID=UPI0037A34549
MPDAVTPWDDAFTHVLWRAQNAVHREVQAALDGLGVTATQLGLAVHLDDLGPLSAADLSRGFHIAPQSVGTALGRLEKLGWVRRRTHPVHRRVVLYVLTDPGLAGVAEGRRVMAAANTAVTAGLLADEAAQLIALLRRVTAGIDPPDAPVASAWPVRGE